MWFFDISLNQGVIVCFHNENREWCVSWKVRTHCALWGGSSLCLPAGSPDTNFVQENKPFENHIDSWTQMQSAKSCGVCIWQPMCISHCQIGYSDTNFETQVMDFYQKSALHPMRDMEHLYLTTFEWFVECLYTLLMITIKGFITHLQDRLLHLISLRSTKLD